MQASERGSKHLCPKCGAKYYDLKKVLIVCPKCGAEPAPSKLPRRGQGTKKAGSTRFGRYP